MSSIADHTKGIHSVSMPNLPVVETCVPDETAFRQLFRSVHREKGNEVESPGAGEALGSVGNPTVACQQDGASDDMSREHGAASSADIGNATNGEKRDSEDESHSNNSMLMSMTGAFNPQTDRRMFADFEAAGLPRKEIIRLAHALHESVVAGRQSVSLGLRVPELGELRFDVRIAGKVVFIHAFVESEQAAAALALAISTLRDKLEEHRLVLGRLDVTTTDHDARGADEKDTGTSKKQPKEKREIPLPSLRRLDDVGDE